ncbi:hypothetical protein [Bryobacter aggregatus]|uniref:hypothetical protein n=1 Tax=Bryobacter aggregatus TaxID=360054 RepID=UPI0004E1AE51|nr:hypothetical protein [Bryobacter aggregatus]
MQGLGEVFGELFAQRGVGRTITQPQLRTVLREDGLDTGLKQLPPPPPVSEVHEEPPQKPTVQEHHEAKPILKLFQISDDAIELIDNRLKATSAADYYRRLTYLFVYAQELLLGRSSTPKSELLTVLKEAKVYDANCRFWLKQKKGFTVDTEDRMKLNAGAREQAIKALEEALDNNLPDKWNPDTKTAKARAPRKKS